MKYQLAYNRKIQPVQYEPIGGSLSIDCDTSEMSLDEAWDFIKNFVDGKLQESLEAQGIRNRVVV